jgi:hypothetical protein
MSTTRSMRMKRDPLTNTAVPAVNLFRSVIPSASAESKWLAPEPKAVTALRLNSPKA